MDDFKGMLSHISNIPVYVTSYLLLKWFARSTGVIKCKHERHIHPKQILFLTRSHIISTFTPVRPFLRTLSSNKGSI